MSARRFALVAGGGTGGHVIPAVAVARELSARRGPESVELVGSRRGLDSQLVQGTGLPVTLLPGRGFSRQATPRGVLQNLSAFGQLVLAAVLAFAIVLRRRPAVVVAMGGYACVPAAIAAAVMRVPVVLVNLDAVPGGANRLVGRFAGATAVAFEGTPLPRAVVTGAPVRQEVSAASRPDADARRDAKLQLGIPPDLRVIGAVGGSLGARRLNEAVLGLARIWAERPDVAVYHVVGNRDAKWAADRENAASGRDRVLWYLQVGYEEQMPFFYQAADVVVCRAGANTVAELAVVGVPSVLVPLPGAPGDHQAANAAMLTRAGAAVVLEDGECTVERLAIELDRLLADPGLIESMRCAASDLGRPDALAAVVMVIEARARSSTRGFEERADAVGRALHERRSGGAR